jgi:hypothetical protein
MCYGGVDLVKKEPWLNYIYYFIILSIRHNHFADIPFSKENEL